MQSMGSQRVRHDSATEHEHPPQSWEVGRGRPQVQDEGPYPTKWLSPQVVISNNKAIAAPQNIILPPVIDGLRKGKALD